MIEIDALRVWLERLLFLAICFLAPCLFLSFEKQEIQEEQIQLLSKQLLSEISATGKLEIEQYERFLSDLAKFQGLYEIELLHTSYEEVPVYQYLTVEEIHDYYKKRNQRKEMAIATNSVEVNDTDMTKAKLQENNNATILASVDKKYYVPLPKEEEFHIEMNYTPVEAIQEIYEGEELITVCFVESAESSYYMVADSISLTKLGQAKVQLYKNGIALPAYIDVTVYPRKLTCLYGHTYSCTRECVEQKKETGIWERCPFCKVEVKEIEIFPETVVAVLGEDLKTTELQLKVTYLDGHTEFLVPTEDVLFNYDAYYCGSQKVTVSYRGFEVDALTVITKGGSCQSCGKECVSKGYEDYVYKPYCNQCLSSVPLFTGDCYLQEEVTMTEDIVACLSSAMKYVFHRGDCLQIRITPIQKKRFFSTKESTLPIVCSSVIRTTWLEEQGG